MTKQIRRAVIPMASPRHANVPFQGLVTAHGRARPVVHFQIEEFLEAGIEQIALVVTPALRPRIQEVVAQFGNAVALLEQEVPRGFGDAILCAEDWVAGESFVVRLCDHVFISYREESVAKQLIDVANEHQCCVSAVRTTPEAQLPYFGIVGGRLLRGSESLYTVSNVLEKPSPTQAEARCLVPGFRQGNYLGFFGIHALTSAIFPILAALKQQLEPDQGLGLSEALDELPEEGRYLALEAAGYRIDLEGPFGLLRAQLALGLNGPRREEVLRLILEETTVAQVKP